MISRPQHSEISPILDPNSYLVFPEVPEVLLGLKMKGWNHVILSNNHPDLEQVLDSLKLLNLFKCVVTSAQVGSEKPDAKIFQFAINVADAQNHIKWMIGDNPKADIEGATQLGIRSILVNNNSDHSFKANNLYEVEQIIEKFSSL